MNIVVVIQARMKSTRLPGKVLLPLAGAPLLVRMLERVRSASRPSEIVVATSTDPSDDPIVELCRRTRTRVYRGDATDLLDRHYRAALECHADAVVKIPSDCPLIDPAVIDRVLDAFVACAGDADYVGNLHPPSWPDGQDVEAMSLAALDTAWREATRPFEREHTTPFLWERPERFRIVNVTWDGVRDYSMSHRWTIDYPEDHLFLGEVYDELFTRNRIFGVDDVLELLARRPELALINARHAGVNWYRHHLDELRTIDSSMTRSHTES
jgi:spore coat polysaccharide biosynthesis protein SpsF